MNPVESAPSHAKEPAITPDLLRDHGISAEEYDRLLKSLGREPTFTELGVFSGPSAYLPFFPPHTDGRSPILDELERKLKTGSIV